MVEIRSQHMQLRPISSIFMCVLQLRFLETSFWSISKNRRRVQILKKTEKSSHENGRCQNPSATVRISEICPRKKQPGSPSKKTPQVFEGEKDLIYSRWNIDLNLWIILVAPPAPGSFVVLEHSKWTLGNDMGNDNSVQIWNDFLLRS